MLTPKENLLEVLNWGTPEWVPMTGEGYAVTGMALWPQIEQMAMEDGIDPFGVPWVIDSTGPMVDTKVPPLIDLDDIENWDMILKFPDIERIDFKGCAEAELASIDRDQQLVGFFHSVGVFERLAALMGFENALLALIESPEACSALFEALTDYKISIAERIIDAYKPEIYINFDDVATAQSLFMPPEVYRAVIKPHHKRLAEFINSHGIFFSQHTCGKCEDIIEDYVEMGASIWHSAQIMNDIPAIQKKYAGKLVVEGGWDSQGLPGQVRATTEDIREEFERCIREYGCNKGYIIFALVMNERGNGVLLGDDRVNAILPEYRSMAAY